MRLTAIALLAAMITAGCSGTPLIDGINCYLPAEVPDGALIYNCSVTIGCECSSPETLWETLFASSDPAALSCWQNEIQSTVNLSQVISYQCTWTGSVYHHSPGGAPNAWDFGSGGADGAFSPGGSGGSE